uniref:Uncharacterized protein n=1 Tax=Sinocyclocheilus rhinocerous TaxID=307959 RepID=A0A673GNK2_9TELE
MIESICNAEYSFDDEAFKHASVEALDFVDRLLTKERKHRMTAAEALNHPWLTMNSEQLSTRSIKITRHKRYYQAMVRKEWNTVVSSARVASGGAIRSQRGVTVSKVKIAPFEHGPVAGQIKHSAADEGDDIKLICNIDNYDSTTEITWYCGVRQLEGGTKYEIIYEDGLATITIKGITRTDDGTYRCKVVNEYGEDSAYTELFVKGVRSYREFYTTRVVKKVKRRVDTARLLQRPPEFTLPLCNRTAYIGEDVRFGVTITVHPEPRVMWLKTGQKIMPGDDDKKYTFVSDKGLYQLVIHKLDPDDDAEYTVVARNRFGDDSCKARLTVIPRPAPADNTLRPMIRATLHWVTSASDGGSKVTNYIIEKCATTAERWIRVGQSRDTHYTVVNLFGKTSYQFRVIAENKFGQSAPSEPSGSVVTKEDKSRVLNYDEEVDDTRPVSKSKAPHSEAKNVHNKYMIAEELGHGQFGIIHRCIETSSEKTYMAKFVKVRGADQALVKKEIATLNVTRHKSFLLLHESFDCPEELVMIYEFISGVDIFERLGTANFELNEREIVNYIRQVCEALEFLHSKSYGHFDIRPENIVYTTRKGTNVKIIELGQSRHLTPGDQIKIQYTTAEFAAPEIHQNEMVSTVTDMWSVGVLVYVLLSGLNPFAAETNQQMIESICNAEYSFDDEAFKHASVEALDFVDRLLTKERKHRMTAAEALNHPWLTMNSEQLSTRSIKITRHKRYYQAMVKKEWNTVVSSARVASGGAIRSQRGVTVSKVKIAPFEHGPVAGQIKHSAADEGDDIKLICNIDNYDSTTEVTWYCGVRQLEESAKNEITYEDELATITIKGITRTDDGTYRCKVVNEYGEDSAYAELFVKGKEESEEE